MGKIYFISALASATSYLNENIGGILNNPSNKVLYISLLNEISNVALAKGVKLPNDIITQTITKLEKTPHNNTSSMHRDLLAGKTTEVKSLTEYVVAEGLKYGIPTPNYQIILNKLTRE